MKQPYESPDLVDYGQIADCTFDHPRRRRHRHWRDDDDYEDGGSVVIT